MIKRIFLTFLITFLTLVAANAQLRRSVAIVRPHLSDYGKETYLEISRFFRDRKISDLANYFKSLTEDEGFGSGFVIQGRDEWDLYVITNGHVVVFSDHVTLEFQDYDDKHLVLEGCPVIFRDDFTDIAVIRVPMGAKGNVQALQLADEFPRDGQDVWSAGYPYLLDGPSWQFGKGNVSNERLTAWQVGHPDYSVFVQHSAPLANGNSGGPLLIGSPFDGNLRVVGMNTWILMGRQNANFAIHLDILKAALERMKTATGYSQDPETLIKSKVEAFIDMMKAEEWDWYDANRFISQELVAEQGWALFKNGLPGMGSEDSNGWVARFNDSPLEALNEFIYFRLYEELNENGDNLKLVSVDYLASEMGETLFRTGILFGKKILYFDWRYEAGGWKILAAGVPGAGLKGPKSIAFKAEAENDAAKGEKVKKAMPQDGYGLTAGLRFVLGNTEMPSIDGWISTVSAEIGYAFSITRSMTLDITVSTRDAIYPLQSGGVHFGTLFGAEVGFTYGYVVPIKKASMIPFLRIGGGPAWDTLLNIGPNFLVKPALGVVLMTSEKFGFQLRLKSDIAIGAGLHIQGLSVEAGLVL
ncbi:MAG: trypsin-like peptidase domain-containing protein [Spirochaetia bacterium]|nr:trypsin-like peptidase domain-containing protein [Spirochaetia bacterium]